MPWEPEGKLTCVLTELLLKCHPAQGAPCWYLSLGHNELVGLAAFAVDQSSPVDLASITKYVWASGWRAGWGLFPYQPWWGW